MKKLPRKKPFESCVYGMCPRCGQLVWLTKHHVFPQRFFGKTEDGNVAVVLLCRECHDELELLLPEWERFSEKEYLAITFGFIQNESIMVVPRKGG